MAAPGCGSQRKRLGADSSRYCTSRSDRFEQVTQQGSRVTPGVPLN